MTKKRKYINGKDLRKAIELVYSDADKLIQNLAPEGWSNSPYHFPFAVIDDEREALYHSYAIVAANYESRFGLLAPTYLRKGYKKFEKHTAANGQYRDEASEFTYLVDYALKQLLKKGCFIKANDPDYDYHIAKKLLHEYQEVIAMELDLANAMINGMLKLSTARKQIVAYIDLSALYAIVLAAFEMVGYDWRYGHKKLESLWASSQIAGWVNNHKGRYSQESYLAQMEESMAEVVAQEPPNTVRGYIKNYKRFPKGYPPTIDYIREISLDMGY